MSKRPLDESDSLGPEPLLSSQVSLEVMLVQLGEREQFIRQAILKVGMPTARPPRPPEMRTLLRIMIGSQVSVAAAESISARVWKKLGYEEDDPGLNSDLPICPRVKNAKKGAKLGENDSSSTISSSSISRSEFDKQKAELLLSLSDEEMRALGLSRQKVGYARGVALAIIEGVIDIPSMAHLSDEDAHKTIVALKGFGPWSAHMYLMFGLSRTNIWPVGDIAVRGGVEMMLKAAGESLPVVPAKTSKGNGALKSPSKNSKSKTTLTEPQAELLGPRFEPHRSAVAMLAWHYYGFKDKSAV